MKQLRLSLIVALFASIIPTTLLAEETVVAPASATTATETVQQAVTETATEAELPAAGEALPPLDNLDFASGEVVTFDAAGGSLGVKVYLDAAGDANEQTLTLSVDAKTEITNGETELKSDSLKVGAEIDVEYDVNSKKATYIFIY